MAKINEIQDAIMALPESDYREFRLWFTELNWRKWNRQIEADSKEGKLDFLISEAFDEKEKGRLKDL